eukprot:m.374310 g.374310  ORF g.374310 m.374310 type:complete len:483 (-) comp20902_c0_seq1:464-1912(-)
MSATAAGALARAVFQRSTATLLERTAAVNRNVSCLCRNNAMRCFGTTAVAKDTYPVVMPALSPTMTEGTLVQWHKQEGDAVEVGEVIFDIETDKATMAVESTEEGYLVKVLVPDGTSGIPINQLVGIMVEEEGEEPEDLQAEAVPTPPAASAPPVAADSVSPASAAAVTSAAPLVANTTGTARSLSPAVLALVNRHGLVAQQIPATGPKGHILKGDVLAFLSGDVSVAPTASTPAPAAAATMPPAAATPAKPSTAASVSEDYVDIPVTNMRKVIASRLTESKTTIPHAYTSIDVDMTNLMSLRKSTLADTGQKFSVNDMIVKASALALRLVPEVNAAIVDGEVQQLSTVDVAVAVATEKGLITPIVPQADGKNVFDISSRIKDMAGRAREGKLMPEEYQGGTFSISNLGMMGVSTFSAVINPPQSCILAVGSSRPKVDESFQVRQLTTFTLSTDARVADDVVAIRWLNTFKRLMEAPQTMIL